MFRVETISTSSEIPSKVIHACLATASDHSNGVIFNVGRKSADLTIENDRSVSRSHCSLRLIVKDKNCGSSGNDFGAAESEDEIQACEDAVDGVAVVIQDLGR